MGGDNNDPPVIVLGEQPMVRDGQEEVLAPSVPWWLASIQFLTKMIVCGLFYTVNGFERLSGSTDSSPMKQATTRGVDETQPNGVQEKQGDGVVGDDTPDDVPEESEKHYTIVTESIENTALDVNCSPWSCISEDSDDILSLDDDEISESNE